MAALTPATRYVIPALIQPAIPVLPLLAAPAIRNVAPARQMQPALDTALVSIRNAYSRLASSRNVTKPLASTRNAARPPALHVQQMQLAPPPATCSCSDRLRLPQVSIARLPSRS